MKRAYYTPWPDPQQSGYYAELFDKDGKEITVTETCRSLFSLRREIDFIAREKGIDRTVEVKNK